MKNPERIAMRFELRGRVQGVGCRAQIEKRVNTLGRQLGESIAGWVRNLPAGEVEILVWASHEAVSRVEQMLKSELSFPVRVDAVSNVLVEVPEIINEFKDFQIRRDADFQNG